MESEESEAFGGRDAPSDNHHTHESESAATSSTDLTDELVVTEPFAENKDNSKSVSFANNVHSPVDPPTEVTSPPFWNKHGRSASSVSYQSISHLRPPAISLEDHSDADDDSGKACWAKHAVVDSWVVVSGATGIGAYVVWNCIVETINGAPFTIRKRYCYLIMSYEIAVD